MESSHFAFLSPTLRGFEATYAVHLRLIGKLLVDFLLVMMTEHFSLGVTAETLKANIDSKWAFFQGGGSVWPKILR